MLEAFPDVMTDRIGRLLDEKGAMAGNVTSRELRDTVQTAIERALKIDRRMREQHETAIRTANAPKIVKEQSWHTWKDGSMHKLSQNFVSEDTFATPWRPDSGGHICSDSRFKNVQLSTKIASGGSKVCNCRQK